MTDIQFQKLLDKLSKAHIKYSELLSAAEQEYVQRFGDHPSNIDDDFWIDTFHSIGGHTTVEKITENAKMHVSIRSKR